MSTIIDKNPYTKSNTNIETTGGGTFDNSSSFVGFDEMSTLTTSPPQFIHTYYCNADSQALTQLREILWSTDIVTKLQSLFGADLLSGIISFSATYVPDDIPHTTFNNVVIGNVAMDNISMNQITNPRWLMALFTWHCPRYFGNFLDFEPYTKISIHIPNIGDVDINPSEIMGKTLVCEMAGDVGSGDIIVYGFTQDRKLLFTKTSNFAVNIPLTSISYTNDDKNLLQSITSVLSGNIGDIISFAANMGRGIGQFYPTSNKLNAVNVSSEYLNTQHIYIRVERPSYSLPANYGKYNGYPSNIEKPLNETYGYFEISSIIWDNETIDTIHRKPTVNEINAIIELMKQGVIKYVDGSNE